MLWIYLHVFDLADLFSLKIFPFAPQDVSVNVPFTFEVWAPVKLKKYILEFRMLNIIFNVEEFANIKKNSSMILEKNNIWSIYFLINLILGLQCYAQN